MCITMKHMQKQTEKSEVLNYLTRAQRQRNSLITTVPVAVCNILDLKQGDMVHWEYSLQNKIIYVRKLKMEQKNVGDNKKC